MYTGTVWSGVNKLRVWLQQQRNVTPTVVRGGLTGLIEDGALRAASGTRVNAAAEAPLETAPIRL